MVEVMSISIDDGLLGLPLPVLSPNKVIEKINSDLFHYKKQKIKCHLHCEPSSFAQCEGLLYHTYVS